MQNIILETKKVLLRPLAENDFGLFLHLAKKDESMWEYLSLKLSDEDQLKRWISNAISERDASLRLPFTIIDKATQNVAGSSSIGNISQHDLRLEIGWSWLAPEFRSTEINRHTKFLLMQYAFDLMQFERVEFKTGVKNMRARRGLEKIGAVEEGILRSHSLLWNGTRRTSVFYSVLKDEWQQLKKTIFADIEK